MADEEQQVTEEFDEYPDTTPVIIVTGFLGSGKTTLINYILQEQEDLKIAVIENEFGAVSIDDALVSESLATKENVIVLDNGCLCCTVRGDLVNGLDTLRERRDEFDYVVIETTGLADVAPIVFTFNTNQMIAMNYDISSILCMVDSYHLPQQLARKGEGQGEGQDEGGEEGEGEEGGEEGESKLGESEVERQIALADIVVLNKVDMLEEGKCEHSLEDVRRLVKGINSFATLLETSQSRVDLEQVFEVESYSLEYILSIDPTLAGKDEEEEEEEDHHHDHHHHEDGSCCEGDACHHHDHDHDHDHNHDHDHHHEEDGNPPAKKSKHHHHHHPSHLTSIASVGVVVRSPLVLPLFQVFMSQLVSENGRNMYRSKGVLNFANTNDTKFVFQGVHEQIIFAPTEMTWEEGEEKVSKMVFIGKDLPLDFIKESVKNAMSEPSDENLEVFTK